MSSLRITFLDVGHGDFAYAETPFGDTLVIDVGSGDVVPSVFLRNVSAISELQVSHPHTDHFDDIVAISQKVVRSFRCPSLDRFDDRVIGWRKGDRQKIAALRALKARVPANNDAVRTGSGFEHTVWFPTNIDYKDPNTASAVTTLAFGGVKILFGADLPSAGWEALLQTPDFVKAIAGTSVFKVPHHGRQEGCCQALFDLASFTPALCVVSDKAIEKDNRNTSATAWYSARARGCNVVGYTGQRSVLTTRSDGSIFLKVDDTGSWWVYPHTQWRTD